eukprot:364630-Chlamydomonas_euryale.AAC.6
MAAQQRLESRVGHSEVWRRVLSVCSPRGGARWAVWLPCAPLYVPRAQRVVRLLGAPIQPSAIWLFASTASAGPPHVGMPTGREPRALRSRVRTQHAARARVAYRHARREGSFDGCLASSQPGHRPDTVDLLEFDSPDAVLTTEKQVTG